MSDLISRQDAIDAICESGVREERKGHLSMSMITAKQWAVDVIEQLPSAEPKIINCRDCKYAHITADGKYCKYCDELDNDDLMVEQYFSADFYCGYGERKVET